MKVKQSNIAGVCLIEPILHGDERGRFLETFQRRRYAEIGIEDDFVQDNQSYSKKGVLRGLHYQLKHPQAKLVSVAMGEVYDVVVDIRYGSPTFGQWAGYTLTEKNAHQLYVPAGCAHGFIVLSDSACFNYKCSDYYHPGDEYGLAWHDEQLAINWPKVELTISSKDLQHPVLADIEINNLPSYVHLKKQFYAEEQ